MHVAIVPSRQGDREYKSYLLRQTFREDGKVKHRTLANLSALPLEAIEAVRAILRGQPVGALDDQLSIERSLPHGHMLAVLGCLRQLGLDRMLAARPRRERELVVAMIMARLLEPASKLATTRNWHNTTLAAWAWRTPTRTSSTPPSTGSCTSKPRWRSSWPSVT